MSTKPKILCAIDCSDCSAHALEVARAWAERLDAELSVIMAYHVPHYIQPSVLVWMGAGPRPLWELAEEQATAELREFLTSQSLDLTPDHVRLVHGEAAVAVVAVAEREKHDWIIMGTHGRSGTKRLALGSVAENVVRRAPCPVLVIPTKDSKAAKPLFEPRLL